jgi:hypothetical protein
VIEHASNVPDPIGTGLLHQAERQVVVLAALDPLAESAHLPHHGGAEQAKVADEVLAVEQLGIPIGLEIRVVPPAGFVQPILVAVNDVGIRMPVQFVHDGRQRMTREHVIVVEQDDELTRCKCERAVRGGGDVPVDLTEVQPQARLT